MHVLIRCLLENNNPNLGILLCNRHSTGSKSLYSDHSPTSSLRVIRPKFIYFGFFFLQIKNAELHSYTLLQHCGKDQTPKRIFNKNISLRLLCIQCRSVAFNAKKSFSRFLRPPNWRWKRRTSKPIFFIKPTWKLIEKCQIYRLNNNVILHIKGFMAFLFLTWNIVLLIMNILLLSQN